MNEKVVIWPSISTILGKFTLENLSMLLVKPGRLNTPSFVCVSSETLLNHLIAKGSKDKRKGEERTSNSRRQANVSKDEIRIFKWLPVSRMEE